MCLLRGCMKMPLVSDEVDAYPRSHDIGEAVETKSSLKSVHNVEFREGQCYLQLARDGFRRCFREI